MKYTLFMIGVAFTCYPINTFAQLELKTAPVSLLINSPNVSVEHPILNTVSIEGTIGLHYASPIHRQQFRQLRQLGGLFRTGIRFYANKKLPQGFYVSPFASYQYRRFRDPNLDRNDFDNGFSYQLGTYGAMIGVKKLIQDHILIELGYGFGRVWNYQTFHNSGNILNEQQLKTRSFFRLDVGYRFSGS